MAWQVKVKYTKTDGIATESIGEEVKNLFNQYKQDGFILNVDTENTNENERIDTMTFLSESKYNEYREALISAICGVESNFSNHSSVEIIEQKEVAF